jgi:hypothetical protein
LSPEPVLDAPSVLGPGVGASETLGAFEVCEPPSGADELRLARADRRTTVGASLSECPGSFS